MAKIETVRARAGLDARREPYWSRIATKAYLGFRKSPDGGGAWVLRVQEEKTGTKSYKALGNFDEVPDHERYDTAKKAAIDFLTHLSGGGTKEAINVGEACERLVKKYLDDNREAAAKDAEGRFRRWVHGNKKFAKLPLQKLTSAALDEWRNALAKTPAIHQDKSVKCEKPRAASSLNRDMAVLKTALNLALEDGYITSANAWTTKLKPVKAATGRRDCYLDIGQRRGLLSHATPDLAILIRAMASLPLRPGAVAALTVGNFDKRLHTLTVGKDKAGKDRKITLPASTAAFFAEQAKGKLPAAPLFARANGMAWNKDSWKYPFKDAVRAAGLPENATAYALRHSTITDLLTDENTPLDTMTVAVLSGTSIAMIEKHYGHLLHNRAAKGLAALAI